MCAALDTLIAQAYGAQAYALMGLHAQRAILILTLFSIPVGGIWLSTSFILQHGLGAHICGSVTLSLSLTTLSRYRQGYC